MKKTNKTMALAAAIFFLPQTITAAPLVATDSVTVNEDEDNWTHIRLNNKGGTGGWGLLSNGSSVNFADGFGEFSITDGTTVPFMLWPGALNGAIIVDGGGVELGSNLNAFPVTTGNPLTLSDETGANQPNIHFNTNDGSWELWANSAGMGIYDGIDGSNAGTPFSIKTGARDWSLSIGGAGYVGVGIENPEANLHVRVDDAEYKLPFVVENTNGINFSGFRLKIGASSWIDFNNSGGKFRVNVDQLPGAEFEVLPNGDANLSGSLTENSDVNSKQDFESIDHKDLLGRVMNLPISEWSYKDAPESRHIGPMAQDFYAAFGLGHTNKGIATIDTGGVALAAIQSVKREKDREVERLKAENAAIRAEKDREIATLQRELQLLKVSSEDRMLQFEMALSEVIRKQSGKVVVGSNN